MKDIEMRDHSELRPYREYIDYIRIYGYRSDPLLSFAMNVKGQGWCSHKQHTVLQGMCKRLARRRVNYYKSLRKFKASYNKRRSRHHNYDYATDYTHIEEMCGCWGDQF